MGVLSAIYLEPYEDYDGSLGVTEVHDGLVQHIPFIECIDKNRSQEERELLEKIVTGYRWDLPRKISPELLPPNLSDLQRRLCLYFRKYIWISDENAYDLLSNWVINTYFRDKFKAAPILIFDGVTISGKSTAMGALKKVAYRGELWSSGSGASMAREVTDFDSTMLLDEILDTLKSDRGGDIYTMMKSCFDRNGMWIRADPKGKSNFKYNTYTNLAISIRGDALPEDVYNRGIRINMTSMPDGTELGDLDNSDEDDEFGPTSPVTLRTELYALKMYTAAMNGNADFKEYRSRAVDFKEHVNKTKQHLTERMKDGQWMYAFVNGMPKSSPQIRDRNRKIASTLYSIGLATGTEKSVIEMIIKQDEENKEVSADTPEALTFAAILEIVEERWRQEGSLHRNMTIGLFYTLLNGITTTEVAERYNLILQEQGNADKDPIKTSKVTATLNALGLTYRRGSMNKSYMDPQNTSFIANWMRCLSKYTPKLLHKYDPLIEESLITAITKKH